MEQPQRALESREKIFPCGGGLCTVRGNEFRLHPLDVPVAEVAPEEVIDDVRGFVKTKMLERVVHLRRGAGEARENPAVNQRHFERHFSARGMGRASAHVGRRQRFQRFPARGFVLVQIHEHESRRIPNFIGERAVAQDAFLG